MCEPTSEKTRDVEHAIQMAGSEILSSKNALYAGFHHTGTLEEMREWILHCEKHINAAFDYLEKYSGGSIISSRTSGL